MNISMLLALTGGDIALIVIAAIIVAVVALVFAFVPMKSYLTALISKSHVSMAKLASLRARKIKPFPLVELYLMARKGGLSVDFNFIESLSLCGCDAKRAIEALMYAKSAALKVDEEFVKGVEIKGVNSLELLQQTANPKNLTLSKVSAICKDQIEILVDLSVAVKLELDHYNDGLESDTILARLQKMVITNAANAASHTDLLKNPNALLVGIESIGEGGSYSVVSVEVTKIDLGRDMASEMAAKVAQSEIANAQIETERRKGDAIVEEQQAKVRLQEMKSAVLEAEAEVPKALAQAIKEGRFSVMDYYKLMNLQADTAMRRNMTTKVDGMRGEE